MVDDAGRDHQTRVQCATCDSSQWMPCSIIKPIPKRVEAIVDQVFCGSKIKPRINYTRTSALHQEVALKPGRMSKAAPVSRAVWPL